MRRLTKREKTIFSITLIVALVYGTINGVFKPIKDRVENIDQQIVALESKISKERRVLRKANDLTKSVESLRAVYRQEKTNQQVMSGMLSEIETVATDLGLKISDMKPKPVRSVEFFNRFSVSLTIDSSLKDMAHFLYILQLAPHSFNVEEIYLDKGSRRNSDIIKTRLVLSKVLIS